MAADGQPVIQYLASADRALAGAALGPRRGADEDANSDAAVSLRNLAYCYAPSSQYPLAPLVRGPIDRVVAYAVDMDGTSTTTEPLALHALEYMVRRFTARRTAEEWSGLDPLRDHPHVIGHSNQHHTDHLLRRYQAEYQPAALRDAFSEALAWTLSHLPETPRARQIIDTARMCGLRDALSSEDVRNAIRAAAQLQGPRDGPAAQDLETQLRKRLLPHMAAFRCDEWGARVRAALDVYYMRYHSILLRAGQDEAAVRREISAGDSIPPTSTHAGGGRLIEPMPGYAIFVAAIKGLLGREIAAFRDELESLASGSDSDRNAPRSGSASRERRASFEALLRAAEGFEHRPAKLALVTASIAFEAQTSMDVVLARMCEQVRSWPVSTPRKERILAEFSDRQQCFDAFITADDACEHRLKPHPDLYSLALARMGVEPGGYARCIGLEDTEPGIVSQRTAGIGCAVALPNGDTHRQDFRAAAHVLSGGLPELLLSHHLLASPPPASPPGPAVDRTQ